MAILDPSVARVLDSRPSDSTGTAVDEDSLIAALEAESEQDLTGFREQRLEQLHAEMARARHARQDDSSGTYEEIKDERSLMDITTKCKLCLVHFFKSDFNRCRIMDVHLKTLAEKHYDTRFLRINVDNSPFLNVKLKIQILPTLIAFIDGISVDRVTGFEGIGRGTDTFKTWQLEARLVQSKVLVRQKMSRNNVGSSSQSSSLQHAKASDAPDDEEDDWD